MTNRRKHAVRNQFCNLDMTFHFHRAIKRLESHQDQVISALKAGSQALINSGITHEKNRQLPFGLTAFCLSNNDYNKIKKLGETVFQITEKAIRWVVSSDETMNRYASSHRRLFPFLNKTPGTENYQIISRYDVLITPTGELKIIELNTGDPAGFILHQPHFDISRDVLASLGLLQMPNSNTQLSGVPNPRAVIGELLAIEAKSGIKPGLIGLLNDEGGLSLELNLYQQEFAKFGRKSVVTNAENLTYVDGHLCFEGRPISLTYNKMRISTEKSERIGWKPGFEKRYEAFLHACRDGAVVPVNNLYALTIAEDKSFMQVFFDPAFRSTLSPQETDVIDRSIVCTQELRDGIINFAGQTVNALKFARQNKDKLVIKPANESRGYKVYLGKNTDQKEWDDVIDNWNGPEPLVIQEFIPTVQYDVTLLQKETLVTEPMYHTLALAMVNGTCAGTICRVSKNPVTNVSKEGCTQTTIITDEAG